MISIIIPVYNSSLSISKTIDSVKNQLFKDFEVIIINDGSTDNSFEIINEKIKNDNRFSVITQFNQGVSKARNAGIKIARFNYIAFLDADDDWENDYLEVILSLINKFPNHIGFGTLYRRKLQYGSQPIKVTEKLEEKNYLNISSVVNQLIKGDLPFFTSSIVIKKNILLDIKSFNEEINCGEDLLTWIMVSMKGEIMLYTKNCVNYNIKINSNGLQRRKNDNPDIFSKEILKLRGNLNKNEINNLLSQWYYARYLNALVTKKRIYNLNETISEYKKMILFNRLNFKKYFTIILILLPSKFIDKLFLYKY